MDIALSGSSVSHSLFSSSSSSSSHQRQRSFFKTSDIFEIKLKTRKMEHTHLKLSTTVNCCSGLTQEVENNKVNVVIETEKRHDIFEEIKHRFLSFKRNTYMKNLEHFQRLSDAQSPNFLVISCADSRVCPSNVLGFQPGEAFLVRNIANLVIPFENGPSETQAALQFSVNTLEVENIFVIGHSCCGGIRALMSMQDEKPSCFITNWVINGKSAKIRTKAAASTLNFDQQCKRCEKESLNNSLLNLLTYPWIEEKVKKGNLSIHGGYYDFVDCTFEKWTLDYEASSFNEETRRLAVKNREFWS
ncbi:beta carbonic anhydrase 5, chloroplastic isoform X1 [Cucumis melo]|uniref:Carbonic anhydrase n=2 Tax=Cucumis melo TaxID=3656 RepID=A0A1S4DZP4_CUCME|nr:beta carbonic anhydrase 5, chloroplastic isoform X1 [Cucumis melo]XP_016901467.2 beta carbonic anhydrase 5, chloroplastic isoform X1 [Cucumis melo]XP_050943452.1 beta carbonic anhydrase 5, chloroplastic isoform X1 [Cucumis melo]